MLDFLFGKDTEGLLMNQQSFSSSYELITKSCFVMGKQNPPIHVSSIANVNLQQTVEKKKIFTKVSFVDMITETDHNNFKESLQEMQLFTKISPVIEVQRDEKGYIKNITNMPDMWNNWELWKKKQLPLAVPDERKQQKIIKNYETGLKTLEEIFWKNMQYTLLLPRCYKFTNYHNPLDIIGRSYSSRFIEKLDIHYQLNKKSFSDKNNIVKLSLDTRLVDENKDFEKRVISFYETYMPDFSYKDYLFDEKVEYTFDKNTSEIIDANLFFIEKLHSNFKYTIEMNLINTTRQKLQSDKPQLTDKSTQTITNPNKKRWTILFNDDDSVVIG